MMNESRPIVSRRGLVSASFIEALPKTRHVPHYVTEKALLVEIRPVSQVPDVVHSASFSNQCYYPRIMAHLSSGNS